MIDSDMQLIHFSVCVLNLMTNFEWLNSKSKEYIELRKICWNKWESIFDLCSSENVSVNKHQLLRILCL